MPAIRCPYCGGDFWLDPKIAGADVACPHCKGRMIVEKTGTGEFFVERTHPNYYEDVEECEKLLTEVEKESIREAALCIGAGAYTAAEFMVCRALESIARRITGKDNFKEAIDALDGIEKYVLDYFRHVRNKLAHPEKISTKEDAESTYYMGIRLMKEILKKQSES